MLFNAIFNNILAISWLLVLLVEETRVPGKTIDLPQVTDKLNNTSPCAGFELTTLVVIGSDCLGSCKSIYHMITAAHIK